MTENRTAVALILFFITLTLTGCGGGGGGNRAQNPPAPNPPPPPPVSNNANLASLTLSGVSLDPAFDPATLSYTGDVAFLVRGGLLEASPEDAAATLQVNGAPIGATGSDIVFAENANVIEIDVTAPDGTTTRQYVVTVTRESGVGQRLRGTDAGAVMFRINELTGEMTPEGRSGLAGFANVEGLAYDAANEVYYGSDVELDELISVDASTGIATSIGKTGFNDVAALAYDNANDELYGIDSDTDQLLTIDVTTGVATVVGPVGIQGPAPTDLTEIRALAYDSLQQRLVGVNTVNDRVVTIDPTSGAVATLGLIQFGDVESLAYDSAVNTFYGVDFESDRLVAINPQGEADGVRSLTFDVGKGLTYNSDLGVLTASDAGDRVLLDVDRQSDVGSLVGDLNAINVLGLTYTPSGLFGLDAVAGDLLEIDDVTGAASIVGPLGTLSPRDLAYDPDADVLYGTSLANDSLLSIDVGTGAATVIGATNALGEDIVGLAYDTLNDVLYGSAASGNLVTIDVTTGTPTQIGPTGFVFVRGLAYDAKGDVLYGTTNETNQIIAIDRDSGEGTPVLSWGATNVRGLAFNAENDTLVAVNNDTDQLVQVAPVGEVRVPLSFSNISGAAFDSTSNTMYAVDNAADFLIRIDTETGFGTPIGPLDYQSISGLAYDQNSAVLYAVDARTENLVTVDTATGTTTFVGDTAVGESLAGLAYDDTDGVLYSTLLGANLLRINTNTAVATNVGAIAGAAITDLTFDSNSSTLYGSTDRDSELVVIDRATAATTVVGSIDRIGANRLDALTYDDARDALLGVTADPAALVSVDSNTASIAFIKAFGFFGADALTFVPPNGLLYGVEGAAERDPEDKDSDLLITINPSNGAGTSVSSIGVPIVGLAHDLDGDRLFGTDGSQLYLVDRASATGTTIGPIGLTAVTALAYDRALDTLFAVDADVDALLTLDPATGAGTGVGALNIDGVEGLAFDPVGGALFGTTNDRLVSIDPTTGAATEIAPLQSPISGLAAIE